jgi:hypothetical protein
LKAWINLADLRQRFILTLQEKKVIFFVLAMFALGLAARNYRAIHPRPLTRPTAKSQKAVTLRRSGAVLPAQSTPPTQH